MSIVCYSMQVSDGARHSSTGILLILAASPVSIFRGWWRCPDLHQCKQSQQHTCLLVSCWKEKNKAHYSKPLNVQTSRLMYCKCRLPKLMNQVGSDACSRSTEWMSDGDSSTVNVALLWIQTKSLCHSQVLRGKSLIHLSKENDINDATK